jgi:hypothetical protein
MQAEIIKQACVLAFGFEAGFKVSCIMLSVKNLCRAIGFQKTFFAHMKNLV